MMHQFKRDLLPAITLTSELDGVRTEWTPRRDLFGSDRSATHFVVEIEHDGTASLRFGDGEHGRRPAPETHFTARYRIGNGIAGNVGAEALWHVVSSDSGIVGVRNPLPARGGIEPETVEEVRQRAPSAFRTQERAVTAADYAEVAQRHGRVQRAAAALRWTGSWHTVFVTIDPLGGRTVDPELDRELIAHVDPYRMAGHDLEIDGPVFVSLEVDLQVCVRPEYFRAEVRQALLDLFSNRVLPDGRRGLFHPDNFTFGQTVYLSRLYAAAQSVPGVASVHITTFKRRGSTDNSAIDTGFLQLGRIEIAQLDNDRNFAERGVFRLTLGGGK
jgi:predicted phage baseplate assembly protein